MWKSAFTNVAVYLLASRIFMRSLTRALTKEVINLNWAHRHAPMLPFPLCANEERKRTGSYKTNTHRTSAHRPVSFITWPPPPLKRLLRHPASVGGRFTCSHFSSPSPHRQLASPGHLRPVERPLVSCLLLWRAALIDRSAPCLFCCAQKRESVRERAPRLWREKWKT